MGVHLHKDFPDDLATDAVILVPDGWEKLVNSLMTEFRDLGEALMRDIVVTSIKVEHLGCYLTFEARPHLMALVPLGQKYARLSQEICAMCGKTNPGKEGDRLPYNRGRPRQAFCPNCRNVFSEEVDAMCGAYFGRNF